MPVHPQPAPAIGAAPIAQALLLPLFALLFTASLVTPTDTDQTCLA